MDPEMDPENEMDTEEASISHSEHKENGNAAYKQKDYRTAIAHYTLAIETANADRDASEGKMDTGENGEDDNSNTIDDDTLATYYNNRAAASTMILQYDEAVSDCDEAIRLKASFLKAYIRKAKAQVCLGALSEATATLNRASIYDPNNSSIMQQKDEITKLQERLRQARELLSKSGSKGISSFPPFLLPSVRDASQALKHITLVIASCPAWRIILIDKTKALIALRKIDEAYAITTTLVRSNYSNNSTLMLYRAYALQSMGNLDDAMKHLKQILSTDPDNKAAFAFRKTLKALGGKKEEADGFYGSRKYEEAVKAYGEALDLDGCISRYRSKLYFNRACAYATLRQHEKVIEDCTRAIRLDVEYTKAILRRAASYLSLGEEEHCKKAMRDYERAGDLAEKRGDRAQQNELKRKMKEAQVALKRSKQIDFYKILGVPRDATEAEIKKSYRKSAMKWHPDRHANSSEEEKTKAEKLFREINLAYEVLSDKTKKAKYDSGVDVENLDNPHAGHGGFHGHGGADPSAFHDMFMRQQSSRRSGPSGFSRGAGRGAPNGRFHRASGRGMNGFHFG